MNPEDLVGWPVAADNAPDEFFYEPLFFGTAASPCPPRQPKRQREAQLLNEVPRIYDALSYLNWQHGVVINTHVTLLFDVMGFADHATPLSLMSQWNQALARWLAVGPGKPRARWKKRARTGVAVPHYWAWVAENSPERGLHAHQLCVIPGTVRKALETYSLEWWSRKAGKPISKTAIKFVTKVPRDEMQGVRRQWLWFRYIAKGLRAGFTMPDEAGRMWTSREIFRPWPSRSPGPPIAATQIYGICHALGKSERIAAGFSSKWVNLEFDELYSGWEFEARRERLRNEAGDAAMEILLRTMAV